MNEKDEAEIRKLLKASPPLTPPESFYRRILEKIGSADRSLAPSPTRWYWGIPAKTLAAACVLMIMVLVVQEKKKSEPELFLQKVDSLKEAAVKNESRPAAAPQAPAPKEKAYGGIRSKDISL